MEFIIIGLFILFFSYILLYSLYDIYFKSSDSLVEGLTAEGDTTSSSPTSSPTSSPSSSKSSSASASASASKSAEATAENASNQSDSANSQIQAQNANYPNATFRNVSIQNKKPM